MAVSWTTSPVTQVAEVAVSSASGEGGDHPHPAGDGQHEQQRASKDDPQKAQNDDLGGCGLPGWTRGHMVWLQRFIQHIKPSF